MTKKVLDKREKILSVHKKPRGLEPTPNRVHQGYEDEKKRHKRPGPTKKRRLEADSSDDDEELDKESEKESLWIETEASDSDWIGAAIEETPCWSTINITLKTLGGAWIRHPVRSQFCDHFQCFDVTASQTFLGDERGCDAQQLACRKSEMDCSSCDLHVRVCVCVCRSIALRRPRSCVPCAVEKLLSM